MVILKFPFVRRYGLVWKESADMKCSICGEDNAPGSGRCQRCGEPLQVTQADIAPSYAYTPSRVQFSLLFLLTFGFYELYWLFKIARVMGYIKGDKNRPWRLLLLLIPVYNLFVYGQLFGEIEDEARRYESGPVPSLPLLAFCGALMGWLFRLPATFDFLGFLSFLAYAEVQSHFTRMQQLKWSNSITPYRYRWGDWLVIGVGAIWTLLACLASLTPSVAGVTPNPWGLLLTLFASIAGLAVMWRADVRDRAEATTGGTSA